MMETNKDSIRVQFTIGKTSSLDLQDWANNQSLPISKAIKEALEHFVRIHGTKDISSSEVRAKLSKQTATPHFTIATEEDIQNQSVKDYKNEEDTSIQETINNTQEPVSSANQSKQKEIKKRPNIEI